MANAGNGTIRDYSTSRAAVSTALISGLNSPAGVAASSSNLLVESIGAGPLFPGIIGEYTASGTTMNASLVSGLDAPANLLISRSDIFVGDGGAGTVGGYTTGH